MWWIKLVGGPLDGQRRKVRELRDFYQAHDLSALPVTLDFSAPVQDHLIPILTYKLERLTDGEYRYVFVEDQ